SAQVRRLPVSSEEAAALVPRSAVARALRVHLPPLLPAAWTAAVVVFVLALRELDLAVVLPAANATAVRRLANAVHFQHEDWSGVIALLLLLFAILLPLLPSLLAGRQLTSLSCPLDPLKPLRANAATPFASSVSRCSGRRSGSARSISTWRPAGA